MSLMLRLLSISTAAAVLGFAASDVQIKKFVKRGLSHNPHIKIKSIDIVEKRALKEPKGWEAYFIEFKLTLKRGKKSIDIDENDILFADANYISPDLIDVNTNRSLKRVLSPSVKPEFYDDKHLLFGSKNAKHKLLVFSDPNCPFCKDYVPSIMEAARKYPDTFALYYYHLPLTRIHPGSLTLCKAMILLQKEGKKDLIEKIYKTDFNYRETNETKILDEINKKLNLHLTSKDINQDWIKKELENDMLVSKKLFVKGTPTVYLDGKKDPTVEEYKKYLPKK